MRDSSEAFLGVISRSTYVPLMYGLRHLAFIGSGVLITVLATSITVTPLAAMAQYQDRDVRGLPKTSETAPPPEARIDINRASVEELLKVPGMTRSWAGRIVRFRPYRTKLDLVDKGIITAVAYDRIKDLVIAHRVPD